ncbi:MAG: hypothetical protein GXO76_14115 [Calditrichaeota bacterium]|nr:hypothetical protein [Calditrichota bacterium]
MSESAVGAVLGENAFLLVQLGRSENGWVLENFVEMKLPHKFRLLTMNDETRFREIRQIFQENLSRNGWVQKVSTAINPDLFFVKEVPVDPKLPEDDVERQVFWETQQFLPEDLSKNYKITWIRVLPENPLVVLLIFRKLVVERIQELFEGMQKDLQHIGVRQFTALTAVEKLFKPKGRLIGLADVGKTSVTITLLRDGTYFRSKEMDLDDYEEDVLESDQNLSKAINRELDRLLLEAEIKESDSPISQLFVHGEKASPALVSALTGGPSLEVILPNPFEAVEIPDGLKHSVGALDNPANWLAGFGAALEVLES